MYGHHAYLYEGPLALLPALAKRAREGFGFTGEHNPDVSVRQWEKFGIDESRELAEVASLRSASGRQLFVLGVSSITTEAQQALLKLFEEPQKGAIFVLLAPYGSLLPTLRSRFLPYPEEIPLGERSPEAAEFLASAYKKRSDMIVELLDEEEGARERVRSFLDALEAALYARVTSDPSPDIRAGLADIAQFRGYLADKAPSLKMLLEHLAATLPR